MSVPSPWKFNTFPCPKDWPHPPHRWSKNHRPDVVEAVRCPGVAAAADTPRRDQ